MRSIRGIPLGQVARFMGVGTAATAVQYATLILLVELVDANPTAASVTGFLLSWVVNYSLNYRFTFHSERPHREAVGRFVMVGVVALALNSAVMATLTALHVYYIAAQALATCLVFCWTFTCNRLWTFAARAR